uniref:Uncharacterized protein n=1 Tax=Daucus carota subsp. sativus TaxID=79200 RepID=A0A161ZTH2_DAUCS
MEAMIHSALEEICAGGANGITLSTLWLKLKPTLISHGLDPCVSVKKALWTSLLTVPGLAFQSLKGDSLDPGLVEEFDKLGVKTVAAQHLRNSFVGLYDVDACNQGISLQGRRVLERLAIARTNGITQSELGKEFGMQGNKIFYVLRKLETRGLIVRQSTTLRKTEVSSDREQKSSSIVSTNMLHLYRFAKHLGREQKLEVLKEDKPASNENEESELSASGMFGESVKEDVQVKDFLPVLKQICDKLEEADNNVLIVSDIKKDIGYGGKAAYRRWRNILQGLKDARVVEEFSAIVDTKVVSCLKLLKKFSAKYFEPKSLKHGVDDPDLEEPVILGKRGQINDQLVELPLEHQVYDMVNAEGSKGLTKTELCKRLGLNNKRYNTRLQSLFSRFGMHLQAENQNRGVAYRVWSHGNFNRDTSNSMPVKPDIVLNIDGNCPPNTGKRFKGSSTDTVQPENDSTTEVDAIVCGKITNVPTAFKIFKPLPVVGVSNTSICPNSSENVTPKQNCIAPDERLQTVHNTPASEVTIDSHCSSSAPFKRSSHPKYLSLASNAHRRRREQRILELLEEKKFMIKTDLHRQLESLEKDKKTAMDRKTLDRSLNKLQREGCCKLIHVGVPVVTNCSRSRTMDVVLHPSLDDISPDLLSQICERVRSSDTQIRNHQGSSKLKKSQEVPILNGIQRILPSSKLEEQSERVEAMRSNGYVSARMVRTKLLHVFLWGYLTKSPGWNDALPSGVHGYDQKNPHSTCKLIELETAIRAMPIELFLQVVGSTYKFEDIAENCRMGMCLSDLSVQEYKHLMGTQATGRLSNLVQTLRGLKLIRMVRCEYTGDAVAVLDATLAHSLELKPYIEEPVSMAPSSSPFVSFDIRPHFRHDFVLSSRKALDEYWNTLEYCYSGVDPKSALHAFPGSAVHLVCNTRSWATARVMTADQRTELNKCIMKNDLNKKLPLSACEKIAKDLNLTLEQVPQYYYYKRRKRIIKLQGVSNQEVDQSTDLEEQESSTLKPTPRRKFSWTENADRQLVIEYAKKRAALGANFHRTDWKALPNKPAAPAVCRRRMALLNTCMEFRKAVLKLCNILTERYANHLEKLQNESKLNGEHGVMVCNHKSAEYSSREDSESQQQSRDINPEDQWDNFNNKDVKMALDNALRHKRTAKLDAHREIHSVPDQFSHFHMEGEQNDPKLLSSAIFKKSKKKHRVRSNVYEHIQQNYIKFLNEWDDANGRAYRSLPVSNAVELFKLVFMNASTAPEVPNLLAETFRRYSEDDLFAAFNYLREAKIMVGGSGTNPIVLSRQFMREISSSPYPTNTGKRAAEFRSWLHKNEKNITEEGIELPSNLQCGDILYLSALLSSREILLSPDLPAQGVGEADDSRMLKRKYNNDIYCDDKAKKRKGTLIGEGEMTFRREKGFPGIRLSVSRATIPRVDVIDLFKETAIQSDVFLIDGTEEKSSRYIGFTSTDHMKQTIDFGTAVHLTISADDKPWEAMTCYAKNLDYFASNQVKGSSFCPQVFKTICSAIQKAGDQGLSMEEISKVVNIQGDKMPEIVVEVLEAFGRALKVNAYDSVQVVDSLYRSKYSLTSLAGPCQDHKQDQPTNSTVQDHREDPSTNSSVLNDEQHVIHNSDDHENGSPNVLSMRSNDNDEHRVTILNLPEDSQPSSEVQKVTGTESYQQTSISLERHQVDDTLKHNSGLSCVCRPILSWMNGDGTINEFVYKGLVRRVLGFLMQNPGMLEANILQRMNVLNPQSCRKLLELMILDDIITVRKIYQATSCEPPSILSSLFESSYKRSKYVYQEHFFANPINAATLL